MLFCNIFSSLKNLNLNGSGQLLCWNLKKKFLCLWNSRKKVSALVLNRNKEMKFQNEYRIGFHLSGEGGDTAGRPGAAVRAKWNPWADQGAGSTGQSHGCGGWVAIAFWRWIRVEKGGRKEIGRAQWASVVAGAARESRLVIITARPEETGAERKRGRSGNANIREGGDSKAPRSSSNRADTK